MIQHGKMQAQLKTGTLTSLLHDRRGNVIAMLAAGLIPLTAMIGGGIDISRAYMVKAKLQQACDAGALAGRKAMNEATQNNGYGAPDVESQKFFRANFPDDYQSTTQSEMVRQPGDKTEFVAKATAKLPTAVMYIFDKDEFDLEVNCRSVMEVSNSDITMVLDVTGSMSSGVPGGGTRIEALRAAMNSFYTVVDNAAANSNARIRYGFVPYSQTVNVGRLLRTEWIADRHDYQTGVRERERPGGAQIVEHFRSRDTRYSPNCSDHSGNWDGYLVYGRYDNTYKGCIWDDDHNPIDYTFERRSVDTSVYKLFRGVTNPTGLNNSTLNWEGCIEERETVPDPVWTFNFQSKRITSNRNSTPLDLDIDSTPTADIRTQWSPYWPEIAIRRNAGNTRTRGIQSGLAYANAACPARAQLLRKLTRTEFESYSATLTPTGGTYHDIGLLWGGRISSPDGLFKDNVKETPTNDGFVSRHLIFMTDGELAPTESAYSSYGVERHDGRITGMGNSTNTGAIGTAQFNRTQSRFLAICEAVKNKGIRLWVVSFSTALTPELSQCASPDSAFVSTNAAELNQNFADIAETVAKLRLSQ